MADDLHARIAQLEAELRQAREENDVLRAERGEALEQQTATSEILRSIASASEDLQSLLTRLLASATRLCDANGGGVWRIEGDQIRLLTNIVGEHPSRNVDTAP